MCEKVLTFTCRCEKEIVSLIPLSHLRVTQCAIDSHSCADMRESTDIYVQMQGRNCVIDCFLASARYTMCYRLTFMCQYFEKKIPPPPPLLNTTTFSHLHVTQRVIDSHSCASNFSNLLKSVTQCVVDSHSCASNFSILLKSVTQCVIDSHSCADV